MGAISVFFYHLDVNGEVIAVAAVVAGTAVGGEGFEAEVGFVLFEEEGCRVDDRAAGELPGSGAVQHAAGHEDVVEGLPAPAVAVAAEGGFQEVGAGIVEFACAVGRRVRGGA